MLVRTAAAMLVACIVGCTADAGATLDGLEPTDDEEARVAPRFLEPADRRLVLSSARLEDVQLKVADIYPGLTVLMVDDHSVGPLTPATPLGHLEPQRLSLFFRGGMVPGPHSLELLTPGTTGLLRSDFVNVAIQVEDVLDLRAQILDPPLAYGSEIATYGANDEALLAVLDDRGGPTVLLLFRLTAKAGDMQPIATLELPGYRAAVDETQPAIAVAMNSSRSLLRVAWRVGLPGQRIDVAEVAWDDDGPVVGAPRLAIGATEPLIDGAEYAFVDRPMLFGPTLVAQLSAFHDVERPRFDETTAVVVFFSADDPAPRMARAFPLGPGRGVDSFSRILDLTAAPFVEQNSFAVRLDGREIAIVDVDPSAGTLQMRPWAPVWVPAVADLRGTIVTATGSFASQTSAFLVGTTMHISRTADASGGVARLFDTEGMFPVVSPSGPPAIATIRGCTVLLLPFGAGNQVQVFQPNTEESSILPLEGVFCDSIAIPASSRGNTEGFVPFACRLGPIITVGIMGMVD